MKLKKIKRLLKFRIYLEKRIKNRIFAGSFVLLEGLNAILEYQKQL